MRQGVILLIFLSLSACDKLKIGLFQRSDSEAAVTQPVPEDVLRPVVRPDDAGDTEQEAPIDRAPAQSGALGSTVASLGTATEPGMWLKTPLVATTRPGKLRWNGASIAVTLIPIPGESGAGSRISLQAMQALGMPLTDLSEIQVSAD